MILISGRKAKGWPRMKIVPVTRNWNDGEYDWSYVPSAEQSVTCWETGSKIRLPDDYRRFMLRFNGGSVYPRFFELSMLHSSATWKFEGFIGRSAINLSSSFLRRRRV